MSSDPLHFLRSEPVPVTLALEGGGSLGAFAWGVLDRLVDVPTLHIKVVSGTSAGAVNAAMLVQGLATGGPAGAKQLLERFWHRVAIASGSVPGPVGAWLQAVTGTIAPLVDAFRHSATAITGGIMPTHLNPLRGILTELLDPEFFAQPGTPELVVAATSVRTGEARLFRGSAITVDVLLASTCLPQLFPTVIIDGEGYWDGGYTSNPPLRPLIEAGAPANVLLVRTTPSERPKIPVGPVAVAERVNEITFGAALRSELRTLALAQRLLQGIEDLPPELARLRAARLHMIGAETEFRAMPGGSRQDPTWTFLLGMRDLGQRAADRWLENELGDVGYRSTLDLAQFVGSAVGEVTGRIAA